MKLIQIQNIQSRINICFTPALDPKIGAFVYIFFYFFTLLKGTSKKLKSIQKEQYEIVEKPTDVTYNLIYNYKKEIFQHRNNFSS